MNNKKIINSFSSLALHFTSLVVLSHLETYIITTQTTACFFPSYFIFVKNRKKKFISQKSLHHIKMGKDRILLINDFASFDERQKKKLTKTADSFFTNLFDFFSMTSFFLQFSPHAIYNIRMRLGNSACIYLFTMRCIYKLCPMN